MGTKSIFYQNINENIWFSYVQTRYMSRLEKNMQIDVLRFSVTIDISKVIIEMTNLRIEV